MRRWKLKKKCGEENNVNLIAVDPSKEPIEVTFKKWDMRKDSGKASSLYVLNNAWMTVVNENALEEGDLVQHWSFHNPSGDLQFALVRVVANHDVPVKHENQEEGDESGASTSGTNSPQD
ncbi:B3 domain-containing protein At2g31720-like [Dillenia turbinata]|uniref:B3 domain-containing protein At2g31720-like n=1 Tax=Dillenia turbinata TaxID=194707 RepID=A0AAN8VM64_9MAGN